MSKGAPGASFSIGPGEPAVSGANLPGEPEGEGSSRDVHVKLRKKSRAPGGGAGSCLHAADPEKLRAPKFWGREA